MEIDHYLNAMLERRARQLLVLPGAAANLRFDEGQIEPVDGKLLDGNAVQALVAGMVPEEQRPALAQTHQCSFPLAWRDQRLRVNVFRDHGRLAMVVARLEMEIPTLDELSLPPLLKDLALVQRGLIIVAGDADSGVSTTLAALVDHRNRHGTGHIVIVEDVVEFVHRHRSCLVTQREVGIDMVSVDAALAQSVQLAPDLVAIGELKSLDALLYALALSERGRPCMAAVRSANVFAALDRLTRLGRESDQYRLRMEIARNLHAMVGQQLIPTADGAGRVPAVELLINTPPMRELLAKGKPHDPKDLMRESAEQGMQTMDQHLFELYQAGKISYEDALRHAQSVSDVHLRIKLARFQRDGPTDFGDDFTLSEDD